MLPFATQYLKANYTGRVTILSGFCPTCLDAQEHVKVTPNWPRLFQEGTVSPEQALNAFNPLDKSFSELVDLRTAAQPCQDCLPRCWVCQSPTNKGQTVVSTERWPKLRVHRMCVARCDQAGCPVYLETIPRYVPFSAPKPLCLRHAGPARQEAPRPPKAEAPKPPRPPRAEPRQAEKQPTPKPAPKKPAKPTAASQKLVRINKECKTPPISSFLSGRSQQQKPSQLQDELVYRRDTGEPWAYRRDGVLYRISDDEPVEDRRDALPPKRRRFDFSPPASDAPDAQEEHEGQAGGDDPDEGARPVVAVVEEPVAGGQEQ